MAGFAQPESRLFSVCSPRGVRIWLGNFTQPESRLFLVCSSRGVSIWPGPRLDPVLGDWASNSVACKLQRSLECWHWSVLLNRADSCASGARYRATDFIKSVLKRVTKSFGLLRNGGRSRPTGAAVNQAESIRCADRVMV